MAKYKLAEAGVEWFNREHADAYNPQEAGAEVELELGEDQERALLAAGWLEKKGKK